MCSFFRSKSIKTGITRTVYLWRPATISAPTKFLFLKLHAPPSLSFPMCWDFVLSFILAVALVMISFHRDLFTIFFKREQHVLFPIHPWSVHIWREIAIFALLDTYLCNLYCIHFSFWCFYVPSDSIFIFVFVQSDDCHWFSAHKLWPTVANVLEIEEIVNAGGEVMNSSLTV